jgi:hypothetical protein
VPEELSAYLGMRPPRRGGRAGAAGLIIALVVLAAITAAGFKWRDQRLVAGRSSGGGVVTAGHVRTSDVLAGDCLSALPGSATTGWVDVVPCAVSHVGQIFDVGALPDGDFPGADAVRSAVRDECATAWHDGAAASDGPASDGPASDGGAGAAALSLTMLLPTQTGWSSGDRGFACVASASATH